uniref:POPDC1-3 domain-containing protein n=1 Tax=Anopheles maculatus TaxID=74869 RepID=A0A182SEG7_9DIPT
QCGLVCFATKLDRLCWLTCLVGALVLVLTEAVALQQHQLDASETGPDGPLLGEVTNSNPAISGLTNGGYTGGHHHRRQPESPAGEVAIVAEEEETVVPQVSRSISASHGRAYERTNGVGQSNGSGTAGRNGHNASSNGSNGNAAGSSGSVSSGTSESTSFRAPKKAPQDGNGVHHDNEHTIRMLIDWNWPKCFSFEPKEHLYYHIGHALFLVAFLAPNIPCGFLWLRCAAIAGCILMVLWGWFVACSLDAVVWFGAFLLVNAVYVVVLLCKLRPVKFEKEIESVSGMGSMCQLAAIFNAYRTRGVGRFESRKSN